MAVQDDRESSYTNLPGPLELFEAGKLDENRPEFEKINLSSTDLVVPHGLRRSEVVELWQSLIRRLKGYKKGEILWNQQPLMFPIVRLYAPPGAKQHLNTVLHQIGKANQNSKS